MKLFQYKNQYRGSVLTWSWVMAAVVVVVVLVVSTVWSPRLNLDRA